ncbi:MAG: cupin domain-containing protein [Gemmatimonadetes bacterium]|nr:cupin domain-containing protein [Gemmatimonadota bacterium]
MSSINRPLAGPMMTFDLREQIREMREEEAYQRSGRAGRTLAKSGRFRLILTAMAEGNEIGTHQADSPMTLQVVEGHIRYRADDQEHELGEGQLLFFGPGDAHDIRATRQTALLITISAVGDDYLSEGPGDHPSGEEGNAASRDS